MKTEAFLFILLVKSFRNLLLIFQLLKSICETLLHPEILKFRQTAPKKCCLDFSCDHILVSSASCKDVQMLPLALCAGRITLTMQELLMLYWASRAFVAEASNHTAMRFHGPSIEHRPLTSPASDHGNPSHPPGSGVLLQVIFQTQHSDLMTVHFENCRPHTFSINTPENTPPGCCRMSSERQHKC